MRPFLLRCANECNNSLQCWVLEWIVGRIQPIRLWRPWVTMCRAMCIARARGPSIVGRAAQMDPTLSRYVSVITEQKKCWESLAQQFDRFQTLHNNSNLQQHATGCANGRNIKHPTMLHPFAPVFASPLAKRFFLAFIIPYRKAQRLGEFIGG